MNYLAIFLAILPIILIGFFYYQKDTQKEPAHIIRNLFVGGIVSALIVISLSIITLLFFPNSTNMENASFFKLFFYSYIFVAFIEEFTKWIMIYKIAFHNKECEQFYDVILFSVYVGLGFAFFENLIYIIPQVNGVLLAILRGLTAIPAHTCFQTFMGYYLSLYKKEQKKKALIFSLLIPLILHGTYDFILYSGHITLTFIYFIFLLIAFSLIFMQINKLIKLDKKNLDKKIVHN